MLRGGHREGAKSDEGGDEKDGQSAALEVFAKAMREFEATIPRDQLPEFGKFDSCESMLKVIEEEANRRPEKSRLLRCCKKISYFAKRWEPFFQITDLLVSSHPDWAALAWGAVRFVFKLCNHYVVFFEKLADMFDRIAHKLPHFGRHISLFDRRKQQRPDVVRQASLVQTLGYIFKDILQFCQEACRIFCAKDKGARYKLNVIKDVFWKPFDVRFSDLLSRLDRYEKMYELELNLADREELMGYYEIFDIFVAECSRDRDARDERSAREEMLALRRQIRDIKAWIQPPDYMSTFERESAADSLHTGSWFFENSAYVSWRQSWMDSGRESSQTDFASRVLFINGSPGYGKTVLSVRLIEDLASEGDGPEDERRTVAFFHFDKMDCHFKEPAQALRAILCQIIHKRQDDKELVDAATVLMDVEGSGQAVASEGEVAVILKFFLERHPSTALVFDGIDECSAPQTFLGKLYSICSSSNCRVVLLSRPSVAVPLAWRERCLRIQLQVGANTHDIATYVRPRMEQLAMSELFPAFDIESAVSQVAQRAKSLFLWAKLLMDYLECPALTPDERLSAISHLNLLEGLSPLYTEILGVIQTKFQKERDTAYRAFQWIAVARRPLTILELRTALAIRVGKSSSDLNYIADFRQSLVQICGALVEIHQDSTVQFIHLSAKEFLTDEPQFGHQGNAGNFRIDTTSTHISIANLCLSYIMHDVPHQPLSGSSKICPNIPSVESRFPLLRYSLDWPNHAIEGLKQQTYSGFYKFSKTYLAFARATEEFLQTKRAVAVWLESVWAFGATPDIHGLADCFTSEETSEEKERARAFCGNSSDSQFLDDLMRPKRGIALLAADFEYLQEEWGHLLSNESCELWGTSVNIFHTSELTLGTNAGALLSNSNMKVAKNEDEQGTSIPVCETFSGEAKETLLLTQVSHDGKQIGSLLIIPSQEYMREEWLFLGRVADNAANCDIDSECSYNTLCSQEDDIKVLDIPMKASMAASLSIGWRARIRIRATSLTDSPQLAEPIDVLVDLPPDHIFQMLMMTFYHMEIGKFRISATFSSDLKTVVLLRCIIRLRGDGYTIKNINSEDISNTNKAILQEPSSIYSSCWDLSNQVWYEVSFSQDNRYFAAICSGPMSLCDADELEYYDCSVLIFKDSGIADDEPLYETIASSGRMEEVGGISKAIAFHPSAPYLAIGNSEAVYLWKFDNTDERPKKIFSGRIDNLAFSSTGSILSGDSASGPVWFHVDYDSLRQDSPFLEDDYDGRSEGDSSGWTGSDASPATCQEDEDSHHLNPDFVGAVDVADHHPLPTCGTQNPTIAKPTNALQTLHEVGILTMKDRHSPAIQSSGDSLTLTSESGVQRSLLTTDNSAGAIIMQATAADGTTKVADLLRLPKSVLAEKSYTTVINPPAASPSVRFVLNKAPEPTYVFGRGARVQFPIVIERRKDDISIIGMKRLLDWGEDVRGSGIRAIIIDDWKDNRRLLFNCKPS